MRIYSIAVAALIVACTGCGDNSTGQVKGRLVENGEPKQFPPTSYSVEFLLIGPIEPEKMKAFTAVVDTDGAFQVHASGGLLPVGPYEVTIRPPANKKIAARFPLKREVKPGMNEFTLDIARPGDEEQFKK